jgi:hypothetical protein
MLNLISSNSASTTKGAVVPIQTITLSTSGGFTFTNIPQGYKHLFVNGRLRGNHAANLDVVLVYPSYVQSHNVVYLMADGSSLSSGFLSNAYGVYCNHMPAANSTAGAFGAFNLWVTDYTSTVKYKSFLARNSSDYNGGGTTTLTMGTYKSTSALTELGIGGGNNAIAAGSTLTLYGIKGQGQ